jgi:hypothetical protein
MDSNGITTINSETTTIKERKGISGSTLKLIAIITMLIDHTAATIIDRTLMARGMNNLDANNVQAVQDFFLQNGLLYGLDTAMRLIGRLAFPIFCFLLVEGFQHTRNVKKYAIRLAIFALVSEIPFDLAIGAKFYYPNHQNVFFTLLIGVLVLIGFKTIADKLSDKKWLPAFAVAGCIAVGCAFAYTFSGIIDFINALLNGFTSGSGSDANITLGRVGFLMMAIIYSLIALFVYGVMCKKNSLQKASVRFADVAILIAGMMLAEVLRTDYSGFGILTIAVMYGLRKNHFKSMLGGVITLTIMSISEFTAFLVLIPTRFYNGKRGLSLKYVFYIFYPAHLLILYMICYFLNVV